NFWPGSYSHRTKLFYFPVMTGCVDVATDPSASNKEGSWRGGSYTLTERLQSTLTVADPLTGEVKKNIAMKYPNYSGVLSTAGGGARGGGVACTGLLEGTCGGYDDATCEQLWKITVGMGSSAPPMSFEVNGKQYVAILAGASGPARAKLTKTPEVREMRNQTM